MSIAEILTIGLTLMNFVFIWFLKPARDAQKILQATVLNQQQELTELKTMNKALIKQVGLLEELVFKITPAEQLQEHFLRRLNEKHKD